ncbi:serine hydrolase domain-containing protein [Candidatus Poribacteria bacterium]
MPTVIFPEEHWETVTPEEAGFDGKKLAITQQWLDNHAGDKGYGFAIVRDGYLVVEWNKGIDPAQKLHIASANKSLISNTLGIAIAEGKVNSADDKAVEYFPELMDVPPGEGPKDGRYAFEKDKNITLRQLVCNTSGYMKPGEEPGTVFHYQTNGMHIVTHCIERAYGLYDISDPEGSPKLKTLFEEKIGRQIGADWGYRSGSQKMHARAKQSVFGWGSSISTTARDLARLGWLWCNWGRWKDKQIVPEAWMRETTKVAPDILTHCPEDTWKYGHAFWTNERGGLWPELPQDGFTAAGAGGHYITVFPGHRLVVVMNPLPRLWEDEWAEIQEVLKLTLGTIE